MPTKASKTTVVKTEGKPAKKAPSVQAATGKAPVKAAKKAETGDEKKAVSRARVKRAPLPTQRPGIPEEQRRHYVEVAAYFIAERRGFAGDPLQDWLEAEAEIDRLLAEGKLGA